MKRKRFLIISILIVALSVISGCEKPASAGNMDATVAINVAVAQTAAVLQTQAAQTISAYAQANPTATLTPQVSPTSKFTATPEDFFVTLSKDTYCRTGTSSKFPSVMFVTAGQTLEVISRNPTNDYYYVKDPNHTNTYCWLWGEFASPSGDQEILPVYTSIPLPTPTRTPTPAPDFSYAYEGKDTCGGTYYLRFRVNNTGKAVWQTISINLNDSSTGEGTLHSSGDFVDYAGCAASFSQSDLAPNEEGVIATYNGGQFSADPTGHTVSVTITLCQSETGGCASKSFTVVP